MGSGDYAGHYLLLLDALHRYYDANLVELLRLRREAESLQPALELQRAQREEQLRRNPPKVQFLRIERAPAAATPQ
jgi:hypothetical protein